MQVQRCQPHNNEVIAACVWEEGVEALCGGIHVQQHGHGNNNQEVETIAKYKDYIRKYTERFQEMLVKLNVADVAVRSIFDLPPHPRNKEEGFTIVTVPAGKSLEDRVLADKDVDYENWRSAVFLEMISGCKDSKKKPFLVLFLLLAITS